MGAKRADADHNGAFDSTRVLDNAAGDDATGRNATRFFATGGDAANEHAVGHDPSVGCTVEFGLAG